MRPVRRHLGVATFAVLVLAAAGSLAWYAWLGPAARAERSLGAARSYHSAGDEPAAERAALAALTLDPRLGGAALVAAEAAAAQDEPERAVNYARRVGSADADTRRRGALLAAKLNHHRLYRLGEAERDYRAALEAAPDDVEANTGLAQLLGLCGRWREAIPHVLRVVRQGEPTDLLVLLSRENGVVHDIDALRQAGDAAADDPNPFVGLAWHAASDERTAETIGLLRQALARDPQHVAANVALGKALLAAREFDELALWSGNLPPAAEKLPETWLVRGQLAERNGDVPAAIRCYWESARLAPESKNVLSRLARLLAEIGDSERADRFAAQVVRLHEFGTLQDRVLLSGSGEGVDSLIELASGYERVGRLWEAYGWCRLAVHLDPFGDAPRRRLDALKTRVGGLPLRLTVDKANVALSIDLSEFPLPQFRMPSPSPSAPPSLASTEVSFRDDAPAAGVRFRFFNGTAGTPSRRMFEFTGGGIGVLDFDVDGFADVYFTQGCKWPPGGTVGEHVDRLFRNCDGNRYEDATAAANIQENDFGQGVTVGDFDADGFPDLFVANIGANRLWRNNGDGTFTDATPAAGIVGDEWTTSCLLADLDGDSLPDVYAVNYVTGDDVFDRVCGTPAAPRLCMPYDFDGESDRLWLNAGDGTFSDATADSLSVEPNGKGLGIAAWDAEGTGRLSVLVANDTTPNFLFDPESEPGDPLRLRERAIAAGVALNGEGKATGCMGIALADIDDDGRIDVFITNFLAEANSLFMSDSPGFYEDRTRDVGLHAPSLDVLGFGTQFLDADLDGRLELFVSNGHVDDLRRDGKPYAMPAQLFRWNGRQFAEADRAGLGPYFAQEWLGRPVARLDWNRDGRDDLAVGHLAAESALLTNTSPDAGRFLSIRLTGIESNRDAIGTTVQARIGERLLTRQLTAGDGYQSSNERRLIIGTGDAATIDALVVRWPSGLVQQFRNVPTSQHVWLAERRRLLTTSPVSERTPSPVLAHSDVSR